MSPSAAATSSSLLFCLDLRSSDFKYLYFRCIVVYGIVCGNTSNHHCSYVCNCLKVSIECEIEIVVFDFMSVMNYMLYRSRL